MDVDTNSTQQFLDKLVNAADIPGIACAISSVEGREEYWYAGRQKATPSARNVSRETIFDLASLTKVLTTHQWLLLLVSKGQIDLNTRVGDYLCGASDWLASCPIWRLSNHTSGLPAHVEFFRESGPLALQSGDFQAEYGRIIDRVKRQDPAYSTGASQVYSDLGYILLAHICGLVDEPLPDAMTHLYGHGPDKIHWCPSQQSNFAMSASKYAATEQCPWRNRLVQGEVHDDNCWSMGGVAGHAGAFGTLEAVHDVAKAWLSALSLESTPLDINIQTLSVSQHSRFTVPNSTRVLGWDRTSSKNSSSGELFTPLSPGHLGFTGTSVWLDVESQTAVTLLTNRVCPSRDNLSIRWVRPLIHNHLRGLLQE